jgi:hypothetical protein
LRRDPSLACECAADHWAATIGVARLKRELGRCVRLPVAVDELNHVMGPRQRICGRYTKPHSTKDCWAKNWSLRSQALLEGTRPPKSQGSCITHVWPQRTPAYFTLA